MTISQVLQQSIIILSNNASARLDAEVLLSFLLKKPKEFLYTYPEHKLSKTQLAKYKNLIKKRSSGTPIAYLTHHKEFYNLDFFVNKTVLIPRPETELLVEETLKITTNNSKLKTLADIGTGSGAVAISLAKNSKLNVIATDICKRALKIAQKNAQLNKVNLKFLHGSLLEPLKNKKIDIIVANLPYLDEDHKNLLDHSEMIGLKYEPQKALYSGIDGLDAYRIFFKQVSELKYKPQHILIEHGHKQTKSLKKIINKYVPAAKVQTKKDLCGLDRITLIKLK